MDAAEARARLHESRRRDLRHALARLAASVPATAEHGRASARALPRRRKLSSGRRDSDRAALGKDNLRAYKQTRRSSRLMQRVFDNRLAAGRKKRRSVSGSARRVALALLSCCYAVLWIGGVARGWRGDFGAAGQSWLAALFLTLAGV